jgi:DNA modification methylase
LGDAYHKKQLLGIPWRVALALQDRGWILRNDIIWVKPNHMPSSIKNRLANAYEHLFFFVKSRKYYYDLDAIREPHKSLDVQRKIRQDEAGVNPFANEKKQKRVKTSNEELFRTGKSIRLPPEPSEDKSFHPLGKNPADVWNFPTRPFKEAHFAVFCPELCVRPILSSCPPNGIVLDPFVGSGTTCAVAKALGRNFIGIDIVPEYVEMAKRRVAKVEAPLTPITTAKEAFAIVKKV